MGQQQSQCYQTWMLFRLRVCLGAIQTALVCAFLLERGEMPLWLWRKQWMANYWANLRGHTDSHLTKDLLADCWERTKQQKNELLMEMEWYSRANECGQVEHLTDQVVCHGINSCDTGRNEKKNIFPVVSLDTRCFDSLSLFVYRIHSYWICPLLLHLQYMERTVNIFGGPVCDARIQR